MHYEIVIPIEIKDMYYNFGIDFWTQQITATNKVINKDEVIVNLKGLGLRLDNKIIKNYNIVKQDSMKVEFGMSVFSKRETLLGIELTTHNGITANEDALYRERIVELSVGIIFAIFTLGFVSKGEKIETPNHVMKAIEAFESEMDKQK